MYIVVSYDISDDKRRTKIHKILSSYGQWMQYSLFECFLKPKQFVTLQQAIEQLIKPAEDSVCIYVLDAGAVKRTITYGTEPPRHETTIIL